MIAGRPPRPAPRLGAVCGGRDNNLNLIRMIAATSVLVSHAWPIALGPSSVQPLEASLGMTLGAVSVWVFFAISGFLIARSYDRAARIADWTAARAMRLFPGLAVVLILTALAMGPATTVLPLGAYAANPATLLYVPRNVTLISVQYGLPGVFVDHPLPGAINGSLWTLFHEVVCYMGVLAIGLFGLLRRRGAMAIAGAAYLAGWVGLGLAGDAAPMRIMLLRDLSLPFFIGTAFYVWRDRIALRWDLALAGCAATALCAAAARDAFAPVFALALTYGVCVLAWRPGGVVRGYNRLGDYSYGVYVYAFPLQQLVIHLFGTMSPWENIALSLPPTLLCAALSWRFVEKPGLALRGRVADLLAGSAPRGSGRA